MEEERSQKLSVSSSSQLDLLEELDNFSFTSDDPIEEYVTHDNITIASGVDRRQSLSVIREDVNEEDKVPLDHDGIRTHVMQHSSQGS